MAKKLKVEVDEKCCGKPLDTSLDLCKVEALVSVDERGQMVLPKELRDRAGISPGDKLAIISQEKDGRICCLYMFKANELISAVRDVLGPLAKEVSEK